MAPSVLSPEHFIELPGLHGRLDGRNEPHAKHEENVEEGGDDGVGEGLLPVDVLQPVRVDPEADRCLGLQEQVAHGS